MRKLQLFLIFHVIALAILFNYNSLAYADLVNSEEWEISVDSGSGYGQWTGKENSDGSITVDGEWTYVYNGAEVNCPFTNGIGEVSGESFSFSATGTATVSGAPAGYNTSIFTLNVSGTTANNFGNGDYRISFNQFGWPSTLSGDWHGDLISGGGITTTTLNTYYRDSDNDGYGDPGSPYEGAFQPSGYVTDNTDCNDYESSIHPGAIEIIGDGIDQDCNGEDSDTEDSGSDNVEGFVTRFYQQCLSREPDTEGLDNWTESLSNGYQAGADLAESFIFSEEFQNRNTSDSEFVTILYNAFFDREPDTSGYNNWMDQLADGMSRSFVLDGFTSAQEFITLCENYGITPAFTDSESSEYIDLAGARYSVTEIRNLQNCDGPTSDYDYYNIINTQQDGFSVTFFDSEGICGSGTLSGTSATITSTWYEDGGVVDAVYNVTFASDGSSFQGTGRATWTDGYDSCQATSTISGKRY